MTLLNTSIYLLTAKYQFERLFKFSSRARICKGSFQKVTKPVSPNKQVLQLLKVLEVIIIDFVPGRKIALKFNGLKCMALKRAYKRTSEYN